MNNNYMLIIALFVVGLTPNNARSGGEYCTPCNNARNAPVSDRSARSAEYEDEDAVLEAVAQQLKEEEESSALEFNPYNDPYAPCDRQFEEEVEQEEEQARNEEPYVIIYRVK